MKKYSQLITLIFLLHCCYSHSMADQMDEDTIQQISPFITSSLPAEIHTHIASFLPWPEILHTASTCRYLNAYFHAPFKPILLDYSSRVQQPEDTTPFLQKIFEDLRTLHQNQKYQQNQISLLFRYNHQLENPAYLYNFNNLLQKLHEEQCTSNIVSMDFSHNYMPIAPPALVHFANIRELSYFNNNQVPLIDLAAQLPNVQKLGISIYPTISDEPPPLNQLQYLRKLCLDLPIPSIPSPIIEQIATLTHLKTLYLQGREHHRLTFGTATLACQRTFLEPEQLEQLSRLPKLQHLALDNFNSPQFSKSLSNFQQLRKLQLSRVNLLSDQQMGDHAFVVFDDTTSRWIPENEETKIINPEDNLDEICQAAQQLEHLESVDLSLNQLQFLPASIIFWDKIKHLNLYNNDLRTLSPELGQLTNLQELNIAIRPEIAPCAADLHLNPELLVSLSNLRRLHLLARRPLTNDLPLLQKLVRIRQKLSQDQDRIQTISDALNTLTDNPNLCTKAAQRVAFLAATLHLLEPTVSRTQLDATEDLIKKLVSNPQDDPLIEFLQWALEKTQDLQETHERPKKRKQTDTKLQEPHEKQEKRQRTGRHTHKKR